VEVLNGNISKFGKLKNKLYIYTMIFGFYNRTDETQEIINRTVSTSRLNAAKHFADRKQLPLKEFLKIFAVKCLI
jgi:hypothetical protein